MDAEDFSAKIGGVGGGSFGIIQFVVRPTIEWRVAIRLVGIGIVAGRGIEIANGIKAKAASRVVGLRDECRYPQKDLLRTEIERPGIKGKTGDPIFQHSRRRMEKENPSIGRKIGMQCEA